MARPLRTHLPAAAPSIVLVIGRLRIRLLALHGEALVTHLLSLARQTPSRWCVTLNWEMVARSLVDRGYRALLRSADLAFADGTPVARFASAIARRRAVSLRKSPGVDVVRALLQEGSRRGVRFGVVGGHHVVDALDKLSVDRSAVPVRREELIDPTDAMQMRSLVDELRAARCEIIFVALGVPKQDLVAQQLVAALPSGLVLGVGGSFDLLSARKKRAPLALQRMGLEWAWRLALEPRLIPRYGVLYPIGFLYAVTTWFRARFR